MWMAGPASSSDGQFGTQGVESPSSIPSGRRFVASYYNTTLRILFLYGGEGRSLSFRGDIWRFRMSSRAWTWIFGDTPPLELGTLGIESAQNSLGSLQGAAWIQDNDRLYVFGGRDAALCYYGHVQSFRVTCGDKNGNNFTCEPPFGSSVNCSSNSICDGYDVISCEPGFYILGNECKGCPANTYKDVPGTQECISCPLNSNCNARGFTCSTGYYRMDAMCRPCPSNATCGGNNFICQLGFARSGDVCLAIVTPIVTMLTSAWDTSALGMTDVSGSLQSSIFVDVSKTAYGVGDITTFPNSTIGMLSREPSVASTVVGEQPSLTNVLETTAASMVVMLTEKSYITTTLETATTTVVGVESEDVTPTAEVDFVLPTEVDTFVPSTSTMLTINRDNGKISYAAYTALNMIVGVSVAAVLVFGTLVSALIYLKYHRTIITVKQQSESILSLKASSRFALQRSNDSPSNAEDLPSTDSKNTVDAMLGNLASQVLKHPPHTNNAMQERQANRPQTRGFAATPWKRTEAALVPGSFVGKPTGTIDGQAANIPVKKLTASKLGYNASPQQVVEISYETNLAPLSDPNPDPTATATTASCTLRGNVHGKLP